MCEFDKLPVTIDGDPKYSKGTPAGGYLIEISNNGKNYSQQHALHVAYDSKCMNCSGNTKGICKQKVSSLFILTWARVKLANIVGPTISADKS